MSATINEGLWSNDPTGAEITATQTCYPVLKQICSHLEALAGSLNLPTKTLNE
jgi:hypothetical protein